MSKKITSLTLCLIVLLTAVSALAVTPKDIVGRWYLVSMDGDGVLMEVTMDVNRDKTFVITADGKDQVKGLKWETGSTDDSVFYVTASDNSTFVSPELKDGCLVVTSDKFARLVGDTHYHDFAFAREKQEYNIPTQVIAAEDEEEFYGTYQLAFYVDNLLVKQPGEGNEPFTVEFAQVTRGDKVWLTEFKEGKLFIYTEEGNYTIEKTEVENCFKITVDKIVCYAAKTPAGE